jgi:hypothetical protein
VDGSAGEAAVGGGGRANIVPLRNDVCAH